MCDKNSAAAYGVATTRSGDCWTRRKERACPRASSVARASKRASPLRAVSSAPAGLRGLSPVEHDGRVAWLLDELSTARCACSKQGANRDSLPASTRGRRHRSPSWSDSLHSTLKCILKAGACSGIGEGPCPLGLTPAEATQSEPNPLQPCRQQQPTNRSQPHSPRQRRRRRFGRLSRCLQHPPVRRAPSARHADSSRAVP